MKVGVIMGGISSEREISLKSGAEILKYINKDKYDEVIPIIIDSKKDILDKAKEIDFAFIALHGRFGEDGTVQGVLETLDIPYSGCDVLTSAICMNKGITKRLAASIGIRTAEWTIVRSSDDIDYKKIQAIGYPVFIKPNNGGSSMATFLVKDEGAVENAVIEGLKYDDEVIIEKYIKGQEISSFILNGSVLPTILIETKEKEFFDYASKYDEGGAGEVIIKLDYELQKKVNDISKGIWDLLGCKSYCRIDIIVSNGEPYLLEVNTLPGLTASSLIPKSAEAAGMSFTELLDRIIEYSLE